ncbi:MAG: NTP transferase domain-containing protein [Tepidiformaceae bacterium]
MHSRILPRAVILAAGDGGRLRGRTQLLAKPLLPLNGRPIISYTLDALVLAGIRDVVVVTGYHEGQIRTALAEGHQDLAISFVSNPCFEGGASLSLTAARDACGAEPFLLLMADHVLSAALVRRLMLAFVEDPAKCYVAADACVRDPVFTDEATKLALADDGSSRVTAIGKMLWRWQTLDAGAFALTVDVWAAAAAMPEDCELSVIMAELARRQLLYAANVSGASWYDIDTEDDLVAASAMLETL